MGAVGILCIIISTNFLLLLLLLLLLKSTSCCDFLLCLGRVHFQVDTMTPFFLSTGLWGNLISGSVSLYHTQTQEVYFWVEFIFKSTFYSLFLLRSDRVRFQSTWYCDFLLLFSRVYFQVEAMTLLFFLFISVQNCEAALSVGLCDFDHSHCVVGCCGEDQCVASVIGGVSPLSS